MRYPGLPRHWLLFSISALAAIGASVWGGQFGHIGANAYVFLGLWAFTFAACVCCTLSLPRPLSTYHTWLIILGLALLTRLLLLPHPESDDLYRYLWEGRVWASGVSPYLHPPNAEALTHLREATVWPGISHPGLTASCPPMMTALCRVIGSIWYHPWMIKLTMILFDMGVVVLLLAWLRNRGLALRYALLYALNPVTLYAFAAQGRLDAVQVFFLCAAFLFYTSKRWLLMFLCLGLAIQGTYTAVLVCPFLINRDNWRGAWLMVLTACAPFLLFWNDGLHLFDSLTAFGSSMACNGPVHYIVRCFFTEGMHWQQADAVQFATRLCGGLFLLAYAYALWRLHPSRDRSHDPARAALFVLGAFLLLVPTTHFWYWSWILPLAIVRRHWAWLAITLFCGAWFVTLHQFYITGVWQLPLWAWIVEWVPLGSLLILAALRTRHYLHLPQTTARHVSVIIPARNEADEIGACLDAILADAAVCEVILVDGGSNDQTIEIAARKGAKVVLHHAPIEDGGGRGGQIRAGAICATGDIIAIVHADARPTPHLFTDMVHALTHHPDAIGGAAGFLFADATTKTLWVEFANDLRAVLLGVYFGDQILFFRQAANIEYRLTPDQPLMEDVETSLRMRKSGEQIYLWSDTRVSGRSCKIGAASRAWMILTLVGRYMTVRLLRGSVDTVAMYRHYYKQ